MKAAWITVGIVTVLLVGGCSDSSGMVNPDSKDGANVSASGGDVAYAKQLAEESCARSIEVYEGPDPFLNDSLTNFDIYVELATRLDKPSSLAAKAAELDATWQPIIDYLGAEAGFWGEIARLHSDGKYTKAEKQTAGTIFADQFPELKALVQGFNRSCATAGQLVEMDALGSD
jgi:hypothetical protein